MENWIEWARGPMFWAALAFVVLGLMRHFAMIVWESARIL